MGLYEAVPLREDLPISFKEDGFELDQEMKRKYLETEITITNGQIRSEREYFCKNASIFDVTGTKLVWGDIAPKDVEGMLGVYYILSEHKAFWRPDEESVKGWNFTSNDPNSKSPFRHLLPNFEPIVFDINYIRKNAIARIVDGEIQTSEDLIFLHYQ